MNKILNSDDTKSISYVFKIQTITVLKMFP